MAFLEPSSDPTRQTLINLRNSLLRLHKTLLDDERRTYERVHGKISSPGAFLQLLISDSWFAWLRPVTTLVVEIDEMLAAKEPATEDAMLELLVQARGLLTSTEQGKGLGKGYFDALQRNPDVAVLHGEVMKVFSTRENTARKPLAEKSN
jgi:hypothetical protein